MKINIFAKIVFLIALFALGNSLIIQPALEIQKHKAFAQADEKGSDESRCCFVCHPTHHQWVAPKWPVGISHSVQSGTYLHSSITLHSDPPIGSIFHPPLAL